MDTWYLPYFNLLVAGWLIFWVIRAALSIISGKHNSISFVLMVHFVFMGLPLLCDVLIGRPYYRIWPGFRPANSDVLTELVYGLYISACPMIWWLTARHKRHRLSLGTSAQSCERLIRQNSFLRFVLWVVLPVPTLLVFFAPDPTDYLSYAAIIRASFDTSKESYHNLLALSATLSVVAASALLLIRKRFTETLLYVSPFIMFAVWVHGKRTIVILALLLLTIVLWLRNALRGWRLALVGCSLLLVFSLFSHFYQVSFRSFDAITVREAYERTRIDYGRDNVMRMTIYAELHPEARRILEHRFQSVLFYCTMYVPRELWPEKPWPYAVYATAAALGVPAKYLGWGITTSWLEEAVANFGWIGFLIGPLSVSLICRIGDATGDRLLKVLTILVASLTLTVHLPGWAVLAMIWATFNVWIRYVIKTAGRRRQRHPVQPLCIAPSLVPRGWR